MTEIRSERAYVPWVILGAGRLGKALVRLGRFLNVDVKCVWNRSEGAELPRGIPSYSGSLDEIGDLLGGAVVWVTVADDAIAEVAACAAPYLGPADIMLHCSGSLDSSILRNAGAKGPVASLHPLLSVADPKLALEGFERCVWTVEGDYPGVVFAQWMLGRLGVEPIQISAEEKCLYHASAVTSAGLIAALMDVSFALAESAGFSPQDARRMLIPLAESTLENLKAMDTAEALTGPVARGDKHTTNRHIAAMKDKPADREVYEVLTRRAKQLMNDPH